VSSAPQEERPEGDRDDGPQELRPGSEPGTQGEEVLSLEDIAEPKPKKRRLPPSRIAFLIFVAVAAVAIVLEWRARQGYTRTVEALDRASAGAEQDAQGVYRDDLEKLIHGSPRRAYDEQARREVLTWRGIRAHRLYVQYAEGGFVRNYTTSEPGG
jgi:hypothetical protein